MKKYSIMSFWNKYCYSNNFFTNYLKNIHLYVDKNESIDFLIIGPFISKNDYDFIKKKKCTKILYISEPIEISTNYKYCYQLFNENIFNFIIGCTNYTKNQIKFPLYINYILNKPSNYYNEINEYVKKCDLNKDFCCLINTHDQWNTRKTIYNKLKNIKHITCPSKLLNNCSNKELNNLGNTSYIKNFLFNICSENTLTNVNGYITEKIINCCMGGAIPIYCGWFDDIDAKIFNKNRILFYDSKDEKSLQNVYNKVKELMDDRVKLKEFYSQDVFTECAYYTVKDMNNSLKDLFNKI